MLTLPHRACDRSEEGIALMALAMIIMIIGGISLAALTLLG